MATLKQELERLRELDAAWRIEDCPSRLLREKAFKDSAGDMMNLINRQAALLEQAREALEVARAGLFDAAACSETRVEEQKYYRKHINPIDQALAALNPA